MQGASRAPERCSGSNNHTSLILQSWIRPSGCSWWHQKAWGGDTISLEGDDFLWSRQRNYTSPRGTVIIAEEFIKCLLVSNGILWLLTWSVCRSATPVGAEALMNNDRIFHMGPKPTVNTTIIPPSQQRQSPNEIQEKKRQVCFRKPRNGRLISGIQKDKLLKAGRFSAFIWIFLTLVLLW